MIQELIKKQRVLCIDHALAPQTVLRALKSLQDAPWHSSLVTYPSGHKSQEEMRVSESLFPAEFPDPVGVLVRTLEKKVEKMLKIDHSQWEPWQATKYGVGGRFNDHMDTGLFPLNERRFTVLFTLQGAIAGGETEFPRLSRKIESEQNRLVLWDNFNEYGNPSTKMVHRGCPVIMGEKITLVGFIRTHPYQ